MRKEQRPWRSEGSLTFGVCIGQHTELSLCPDQAISSNSNVQNSSSCMKNLKWLNEEKQVSAVWIDAHIRLFRHLIITGMNTKKGELQWVWTCHTFLKSNDRLSKTLHNLFASSIWVGKLNSLNMSCFLVLFTVKIFHKRDTECWTAANSFWRRALHLHTDCLHSCQQTLMWIFHLQSIRLHFLSKYPHACSTIRCQEV